MLGEFPGDFDVFGACALTLPVNVEICEPG